MTALASADGRRVWSFVVGLLAQRRRQVAATTIAFVAATSVTLAGPPLLGAIVDVAIDAGDRGRIDVLAGAFLAITVAGAALAALAELAAARLGERVLEDLRNRTFDHAVRLSLRTVQGAGSGDLLSRLTTDVEVLTDAVRRAVPKFVLSVMTIALTLGALVLLDPLLAGAALVAAPIAFLAGRRYLRRSPAVYAAYREHRARHVGRLHEALVGVRTIRGLRRERVHRRLIRDEAEAWLACERVAIGLRNRLRFGVTAAQYAALAAVLGAGAAVVDAGAATVGVVTAAALYVLRVFDPVAALLEWLDELQSASASLARIVGLLDTPVLAPPERAAAPAGVALRARGLRFAYLPGRPAVDGVAVTIARGEHVAVVGTSGAGKSTLAALLAGLLEPQDGTVDVAGGARVALLPQDPHVFATTVAANLRLGRPDAPEADLHAALRTVGARWATVLPLGLDTVLGRDGQRLGPAPAQQLALARLIVCDPAIAILDEATASIGGGASALERALHAALRGRTVVTVAHRLTAAAGADRVLVMECGRIVQDGTHKRLLAEPGPYARLWQAADAGHAASSSR